MKRLILAALLCAPLLSVTRVQAAEVTDWAGGDTLYVYALLQDTPDGEQVRNGYVALRPAIVDTVEADYFVSSSPVDLIGIDSVLCRTEVRRSHNDSVSVLVNWRDEDGLRGYVIDPGAAVVFSSGSTASDTLMAQTRAAYEIWRSRP